MTSQITIGKIALDAAPVPALTAAAVLEDDLMKQGLRRPVWSWKDGKGQYQGPVTREGAVPLACGLVFHASVPLPGGAVGRDPAASARMAKRFLQATGAGSIAAAVKAVTILVKLPMKTVPLNVYEGLRAAADFEVIQDVDYVTVALSNRSADLLTYLCLPNRVRYWARVTETRDALAVADLKLDSDRMRPAATVPAPSAAAKGLRLIALEQRSRDMIAAQKALPEGPGGATARDNLAAASMRLEEDRRAVGGNQARMN